mmetsp:Transcript_8200/g.21466  ORF Transcript_8200/g.21466 Transcript_8200/m.21466 type:complete len:233 (-) Transcript_8200:1251-1949(-)
MNAACFAFDVVLIRFRTSGRDLKLSCIVVSASKAETRLASTSSTRPMRSSGMVMSFFAASAESAASMSAQGESGSISSSPLTPSESISFFCSSPRSLRIALASSGKPSRACAKSGCEIWKSNVFLVAHTLKGYFPNIFGRVGSMSPMGVPGFAISLKLIVCLRPPTEDRRDARFGLPSPESTGIGGGIGGAAAAASEAPGGFIDTRSMPFWRIYTVLHASLFAISNWSGAST